MKQTCNIIVFLLLAILVFNCKESTKKDGRKTSNETDNNTIVEHVGPIAKTSIDTMLFNKLQMHLVHGQPTSKWPVKTTIPLPGALLPYNRVVAFYGNFYSKRMGILGELPADEMVKKLRSEARNWEIADSLLPVKLAIHYIAVTAQGHPGKDGKYRLRMPFHQIDKAVELASAINGIVFLDIQVGHCTLNEELPALEQYFKFPNIHAGIDPEYSMKGGEVPCKVIGTYDAADINYAINYLADLVVKYDLPPKILVVHRFTKGMLTNYRNIKLRQEVQVVIDMDGFGFPAKKKSSYEIAVSAEPVQYAGFKLFYKNDRLTSPYRLMSPKEILELYPSPIYIQYQ